MNSSPPRVLLLRVEPASYMVALARALDDAWPGELDVVFMARALTQNWEEASGSSAYDVLPEGGLAAARALRRRILETRPDLVHVAGWSKPASIAAILTARARNTPVVVDSDSWRGSASSLCAGVKRIVYPRLFGQVTHFAPGGERQAAYLRSYGAPDDKITPVNMSVDVVGIRSSLAREPKAGAMLRQRLGLALEAPVALFVGRLLALKGLDDLFAAWPRVVAAEPKARLLIAGDGERRAQVEAMAAADPTIRPLGRLSGEDVWRAYAAADLVVAPSRFEPWGLVVNEAMAAGAPLVVTDVFGCVGDLARNEETALVVASERPQELARAMSRLIGDPALRLRLAGRARRLISGWTIEAQAKNIASIWRRALAKQAGA